MCPMPVQLPIIWGLVHESLNNPRVFANIHIELINIFCGALG